jgi:hypothetical protein
MEEWKKNSMQMMTYLKRAIVLLETQQKSMGKMANSRDFADKGQTKMLQIFRKYEEIGLNYYAKEEDDKKNFTNPKNEGIQTKIDESETKWTNPLRESYYWIKNENSDVQGMYSSLEGREILMKDQLAAEKKIKSD